MTNDLSYVIQTYEDFEQYNQGQSISLARDASGLIPDLVIEIEELRQKTSDLSKINNYLSKKVDNLTPYHERDYYGG